MEQIRARNLWKRKSVEAKFKSLTNKYSNKTANKTKIKRTKRIVKRIKNLNQAKLTSFILNL